MIDKNILFSVSILTGNQITPEPKNITFFVEKFDGKLVPTSTKQDEYDILQLSNSDEEIMISFMPHGSVFTKVFDSNSKTMSIYEFCIYVSKIWSIINEKYPTPSNRIGVTSKVFFKELSKEKLEDIYLKTFTPLKGLNLDQPKAWTKESISQITRQIGNLSEELNVIIELRRVQGSFNDNSAPPFDRIEFGIHINTIEDNTDYRFNDNQISIIFNDIVELHTELTNLIIEHIK